MPRGGPRPGSGRPRKWVKMSASEAAISAKADELPLPYMLRIMRDPTVENERRDKMAALAAPYCHPRMYDNRFGKKDAALEEAGKAAEGSEWADELGADPRTAN
jgi:hypothetical protein